MVYSPCTSDQGPNFFSADFAQPALSFFRFFAPSNNLRTFLKSGEIQDTHLFPWLSVGVFLVLAITACLLATNHRLLPRVKVYNVGSARCCTAFIVLATILCVGMAAYAVVVNDYFYESYIRSECSLARITQESLVGNTRTGWLGLEAGVKETSEIVSFLQEHFDNSTRETWGNSDWMQNTIEAIGQEVDYFYEKYYDMGVLSPNPLDTDFTKIPTYYTSHLGPPGVRNTFTGLIMEEIHTRLEEVLTILMKIKNTAFLIDQSLDYHLEAIETSISELTDFKTGIESLIEKPETANSSRIDAVRSAWFKSTWLALAFILVPMVALLLVTWIILNEEWMYYKLLYAPCVLVSGLCIIVSFSVSEMGWLGVAMSDACEVLQDLHTESGLYTYSTYLTPRATDFFNICLNRDGDLVTYLRIDSNLEFLTHLRTLRNKIQMMKMDVTALTNFRSLDINRQFIEEALSLYINVADSRVPLDQDPAHVLAELNSWTDGKVIDGHQRVEGNCRVTTSDNWVFYFSDCKRGYDEYVSPDDPTDDRGKKCCMELVNWTNKAVHDRYEGYLKCSYVVSVIQPPYGTVSKAIIMHHERLLEFAQSVQFVFEKIETSFEYLERVVLDYANRTIHQVQLTEDYLENMGQVLDLASSEAGGLSSTLNCTFAKTFISAVEANICNITVPSLYVFTLLFLSTLVSGLFFTAAILVLMRRMKKRLRRR